MIYYVIVDYQEEGNSVAFDRHAFEDRTEAVMTSGRYDHRSPNEVSPIERWDTDEDGPIKAPGQVFMHQSKRCAHTGKFILTDEDEAQKEYK